MHSWLRALRHHLWLIALFALVGCGGEGDIDPGTADPLQADVAADRLEGELEVLVVDYEDGSSEMQYFLRVGEDQVILLELQLPEPPTLVTGDRVVVHGAQLDDRFIVESMSPANTDDDIGSIAQALTGNAVRTRSRVAALLVHWGSPDGLTASTMRSRVFTSSNSTAHFHKEGSYDLVELTGDAFGWFRIAAPSGCDYRTIASRARTAAANAGVNLSNYDQIMYYFPRTSACGWSGLATVGRPTSPARDSWYNGASGCVVLAHELQHNFGSLHSRSYTCSGGRTIAGPSSCSFSEYGDRFDVMGGGCYHTNNYQKSGQGWFGGCNVVTVDGTGTFDVVPTQLASNGLQTLRVPMSSSLCPSGMSSCFYTIEYRQPVGVIEGGYSSSQRVYQGVLVHIMPPVDFSGGSRLRNPYLLDMVPSTSTFADAPLLEGRTFQDPNGIRISVLSLDRERARVRVERPGTSTPQARCIDGSTPGSGTPTDTTPPVVTQVSPDDGVTLPPGTIELVATVTDDVAVAQAELIWTNGGNSWTVDCATAQSPFGCSRSGDTHTWTVQVGVEGTRTWRVRGTDTSGNATTSPVRTIEVADVPPPDTSPPVVTQISPADGATRPPGVIEMVATVTDDVAVDRTELIWTNGGNSWTVDCDTATGAFSCSRSGDTYTFTVEVSVEGTRTWTIRGTDTSGNVTTSPARTIEVSDAPPPDEPPEVTHVSPAHGAVFPTNSTIPVTANVTSAVGVDRAELIWWNDGTTTVVNCATASGAVSCTRSGDDYTWSVRVGGGTHRWWRVRGTDTAGRQTTSSWSLIYLR